MATFAVALTPTAALAAPPANDDFENAQVLSGPGVVTGTNVDATTQDGEPVRHITDDNVDYAPTASVWYQWTSPDVPSPSEMLLTTRGSEFDTVLTVFTGGPGLTDLTEVVGDDDFDQAAGHSRLRFQPTQDTVYYFAVDSCCDGNAYGSGSIRLRLAELSGQGSIDGFVTAPGGGGVDGFCVIAVDDTGEQVSTTGYTDPTGEYIINSVEAGPDRHLKFYNCMGTTTYAGEYNGDAQTLAAAPDIAIANGQTLHVNATMDPGGSISGVLSPDDAGSASSVADICVRVTMVGEPDNGFEAQATTNASGQYTVTGLDGGSYRVRFGGYCAPNSAFAPEYYDDAQDVADADLVVVTEGSDTGGIDAGLGVAPGAISGTVREWQVGPGIANICVRAVGPSYTSPTVFTDANGDYTIPNVPPGTDHIVRFTDCNTAVNPLTTQWYDQALTVSEADPITVTSGSTTPSIDASMFHAAEIGGHVTDSAGSARAGVCVDVYQSGGSLVRGTTTAVDGGWTAPVAPGNYAVSFYSCGPGPAFQDLWWHSRTDLSAADDVFVDQGDVVTDLDQLLPDDGLITGRVTNGGGAPLRDICVTAFEDDTSVVAAQDFTDAYGFFDLGVAAGDYDVQYLDCDDLYREQWYDGKPDQATADTITVPTDSTVRASATLARWGTISGLITDEDDQPVTGICVSTYDANGVQLGNEIENRADGTYTVGGMSTGSYRVRYQDCSSGVYGTEFYDNKLDLATADGVPVTLGTDHGGVNAVLHSDPPTNEVLPAIDGVAQVGVTLRADPGQWTHDPATYDYQWYRCDPSGVTCNPVNSAGASYFVTPGDAGQRIRVDVTATNTVGSETATAPLSGIVGSGPPENDDIADRTTLSGSLPVHVIGTNVDATREPGEPAHGGFTIGASVWYQWTAPSGASAIDMAQIDTSASDYLSTISVYTGTSPVFADLELVAQDSYLSSASEVVTWEPVAGTTYYIAIDGSWDSTNSRPFEGTIDLKLAAVSGISGTVTDTNGDPIRDICVTATGDTGNSVLTAADGTYLMPLDPGNYIVDYTDCAYEYQDQWFDLANDEEDATPVHVSAETLTPEIDATLTRLVDFGSIAGTVTNEQGDPLPNICVYVMLDSGGFGGSTWTADDGTFLVRGLGDPDFPDDVVQYDVSYSDCSGFYGDENYDNKINGDVDPVGVRLDEHVTGIDAVLQHDPPENLSVPTIAGKARVGGLLKASHGTWVHEPSVFTFQWFRCEADGTGCVAADDGDARRYRIAPADEGYRFQVEVTAQNSIGTATATSAQTAVVDNGAPANDDIADRQVLAGPMPIVATGDNVNATREVGEPDHLGFIEGASVWYEWTAPSSGLPDRVSVSLAGSSFDTTLSIYDGTPSPFTGLDLVAENDQYSDETSVATFEPVPGTTYYIAVDGFADDITHEIDMGSIDLRLNAATGVEGTVVDEDGLPIRDICVTATQDPGPEPDGPQVFTAADGTYFLELPPGTWYVDFFDCANQYEEQWFDGEGSYQTATPITVTDGLVEPGVDATMVEIAPFGTIAGTVLNEADEPIPDICVVAIDFSTGSYGEGCTDANGTYLIRGLGDPDNPTDQFEYVVGFQDCGCFYGTEFYDNKLDPSDADLVSVALDQHVTGIDATLQSDAPTNVTRPAVQGSTVVGSTLSATNGQWNHEPSFFEYQWQRCSSGTCAPIAGAESDEYISTPDDVGMLLRVTVTATNSIGSTGSLSTPSDVIGAPGSLTQPVVSGTTSTGSTLSVTDGTWSGSPTSFSYQWQRCTSAAACSPIGGAAGSSYVITGADSGFQLRATVTATNAAGSNSRMSTSSGTVGAPGSLTQPVVSGSSAVGSTLSVSDGTWSGSPSSFGYQWLRCDGGVSSCTPISGAQASSYVSTPSDSGFYLRANVTATNASGSTSRTSGPSGLIGAPGSLTQPQLSGSTSVGSTMSVSDGTWSGSPSSFTYQWLRCDSGASNCTQIPGAQASTYVTTDSDIGSRLRANVTAINSVGGNSRQSSPSGLIGSPSSTQQPYIEGDPATGSTLTVREGLWTGSPSGYAYQWLRCDTDAASCDVIAGAESSTYVTTLDDVGHRLRVAVTASNASGGGARHSTPTGIIGAPRSTSQPIASGSTTVGGILSVTTGTWNDNPTAYAYQWLRCDTSAGACTEIDGADSSTYVTTVDDVGHRLRARVTATNAIGDTSRQSTPTGVVT
ncbi:carboxypeptidase regulatory-like domain-containing protein [Nocardioides caricicola]|uniref:alpha-amylase n=1 Tax=Nocardioides caricicola TaxID=634770 RepID=A0ABW0MZ61_9ACTN